MERPQGWQSQTPAAGQMHVERRRKEGLDEDTEDEEWVDREEGISLDRGAWQHA